MKARLAFVVVLLGLLLSWAAQAEQGPIKAYKNLTFLDSRSETTKKILADKSLQGNTYACFTKVGNEQYGVQFDFYEDKLYRVRLTSNFPFSTRIYGPSKFDTVLASEVETLRRVIEAQYGPPHFVDDVTLLDMKDGLIRYRYAWVIDGVKEIKIGMACQAFQYWAELWIGYMPILEEIKAKEIMEEQKAIEGSMEDF